jgi:hypothetical protein
MSFQPKTVAQLRCIWGLAKKMDMDSDELHGFVKKVFPEGDGHLSSMSSTEAKHIIKLLKQKAGQPFSMYWKPTARKQYKSQVMDPSQRDKAFLIAREIMRSRHRGEREGMENKDAWDLLHKLARRMDVPYFHRCSNKQASAIIEALKAIKKKNLTK